MKSELKRRAWLQAAQWLDRCIDALDLDPDPENPITEEEEGQLRNYMRTSVLKSMRSSGTAGFQNSAVKPNEHGKIKPGS